MRNDKWVIISFQNNRFTLFQIHFMKFFPKSWNLIFHLSNWWNLFEMLIFASQAIQMAFKLETRRNVWGFSGETRRLAAALIPLLTSLKSRRTSTARIRKTLHLEILLDVHGETESFLWLPTVEINEEGSFLLSNIYLLSTIIQYTCRYHCTM